MLSVFLIFGSTEAYEIPRGNLYTSGGIEGQVRLVHEGGNFTVFINDEQFSIGRHNVRGMPEGMTTEQLQNADMYFRLKPVGQNDIVIEANARLRSGSWLSKAWHAITKTIEKIETWVGKHPAVKAMIVKFANLLFKYALGNISLADKLSKRVDDLAEKYEKGAVRATFASDENNLKHHSVRDIQFLFQLKKEKGQGHRYCDRLVELTENLAGESKANPLQFYWDKIMNAVGNLSWKNGKYLEAFCGEMEELTRSIEVQTQRGSQYEENFSIDERIALAETELYLALESEKLFDPSLEGENTDHHILEYATATLNAERKGRSDLKDFILFVSKKYSMNPVRIRFADKTQREKHEAVEWLKRNIIDSPTATEFSPELIKQLYSVFGVNGSYFSKERFKALKKKLELVDGIPMTSFNTLDATQQIMPGGCVIYPPHHRYTPIIPRSPGNDNEIGL